MTVLTIAIAGIPRSGKTTMAIALGLERRLHVLHTDDLAELEWSEVSAQAALWFDDPERLVIEGVAVPRALRKWLRSHEKAHEKARPCEKLYWLGEARMVLSKGQATMARGCATIFAAIRPELEARGVEIILPEGVIERWEMDDELR